MTRERYITLTFDLCLDHSERFLLLIMQTVTFFFFSFSSPVSPVAQFLGLFFPTKRYEEGNSCISRF